IDWGEDIPNAANRELKEETGLKITKIKRLRGVYSDPKRDPRIHSISVVLEVEAEGELYPEDKLEVLQVKAFAKDELPLGNLSHDHDRQLHDYLNDQIVIA
ncbi:MAG: NUDIX domain-containing protein, partial [Waterburya sp.]